jgi:protein involved in ribonucleotide reduction
MPRTRSYKHCRAGLIASSAGNRVVTVNLTLAGFNVPRKATVPLLVAISQLPKSGDFTH